VTNAANHSRDLDRFVRQAEEVTAVEVSDRLDAYAMLAVQGPLARELVQALSDRPLPPRMTAAARELAGIPTPGFRTRATRRAGGGVRAGPRPRAPAGVGGGGGAGGRPPRRSRGPRHAPPGGLLSALRERADARAGTDRSGSRLVLQGGDGLHRRRVRRDGALD